MNVGAPVTEYLGHIPDRLSGYCPGMTTSYNHGLARHAGVVGVLGLGFRVNDMVHIASMDIHYDYLLRTLSLERELRTNMALRRVRLDAGGHKPPSCMAI